MSEIVVGSRHTNTDESSIPSESSQSSGRNRYKDKSLKNRMYVIIKECVKFYKNIDK